MSEKELKLLSKRNRYNTLKSRGDKNLKAGGVLKRLEREIRNLEKELV